MIRSYARTLTFGLALCLPLAAAPVPANAQAKFKVVIGNIINWENQGLQLGIDAGIYQKHGVELENVGAEGAGETMQAVISGSADLGGPIAMAGLYRAFARGAPVRILLPMFTGDNTYWYVKADSPLKSLKDATAANTISYSTSGSTTDLIVSGFIRELGVKAKPVKTGGIAATYPQVMSGQVDIGWAAPPFGLQEIAEGKIRIIGRGVDLPALRTQTVRVLVVNTTVLKQRKDDLLRFVKAYRETVDWMYTDPKAMELYAEKMKKPVAMIRESVATFQPRTALQFEHVADVDASMRDAVALKFIDKPLTKEQLSELIQIPPVAK
jgi:NitT/TauT family transport system substrate-binding protein